MPRIKKYFSGSRLAKKPRTESLEFLGNHSRWTNNAYSWVNSPTPKTLSGYYGPVKRSPRNKWTASQRPGHSWVPAVHKLAPYTLDCKKSTHSGKHNILSRKPWTIGWIANLQRSQGLSTFSTFERNRVLGLVPYFFNTITKFLALLTWNS